MLLFETHYLWSIDQHEETSTAPWQFWSWWCRATSLALQRWVKHEWAWSPHGWVTVMCWALHPPWDFSRPIFVQTLHLQMKLLLHVYKSHTSRGNYYTVTHIQWKLLHTNHTETSMTHKSHRNLYDTQITQKPLWHTNHTGITLWHTNHRRNYYTQITGITLWHTNHRYNSDTQITSTTLWHTNHTGNYYKSQVKLYDKKAQVKAQVQFYDTQITGTSL